MAAAGMQMAVLVNTELVTSTISILNVRSGDVLIWKLHRQLTAQERMIIQEQIETLIAPAFPGLRVVLVSQDENMIILRPEGGK